MSGRVSDVWKQREREIAALISDELGFRVQRKLGAGRAEDTGDLHGVPGWTIQVAAWDDVRRAARVKTQAAEVQRLNAGNPFACAFVRFNGGLWLACQTVPQWAAVARETLPESATLTVLTGSEAEHPPLTEVS